MGAMTVRYSAATRAGTRANHEPLEDWRHTRSHALGEAEQRPISPLNALMFGGAKLRPNQRILLNRRVLVEMPDTH